MLPPSDPTTARVMIAAADRAAHVDPYIAGSQAPAFGLHLTKTSNGIAYEVRRDDEPEALFIGDRAGVSVWRRGYGAALAHPAIVDLADAINDEDAGNDVLLDMAMRVADLPPGGVS